jgi:hypothetical protein
MPTDTTETLAEDGVAKLASTITQSKITFLGVDGAEIAYRFPSDILAHAFDAALKRLANIDSPEGK